MNVRTLALWACLLAASASFGNTYTIKAGDTVEKIARKTGVSASEIRKANPGLSETRLQIGKEIRLSSSQRSTSGRSSAGSGNYTVRSGDNNWDLAKRYGISVAELSRMNGGRDLTRIRPGDKIRVPAPKTVAKAPAKVVRQSTMTKAVAKFKSTYVRVSGDDVRVRSNPTTDSSRLGSVDARDYGKVLRQQGEWLYVQFNDVAGWIRKDLVKGISAAEVARLQAEVARRSTSTEVVALSNKSEEASQKKSEPKKDEPKKRNVKSGGSADRLIDNAKELLGTRYVWGGTSRGGFDCSGFVGYVMRKAGINLPRTSSEQATRGTFVARASLQRGDLVFFNTRGSRISHVGIFIGNGQFIHASSGSGRVRINYLNEKYYSSRYVTGRRVGNFDDVSRAVEDVRRVLEETGELPVPADSPELKVRPGADEVIK